MERRVVQQFRGSFFDLFAELVEAFHNHRCIYFPFYNVRIQGVMSIQKASDVETMAMRGCWNCRVEPMVAHPGSDREGLAAFPPLQTEQARFRALRFPVGPVDSGRTDSPLPTERCTSLEGPSSAFPSASVSFPFDRLTLTDLHPVLAITARHWATMPPPPSVPYARIFASHQDGSNGFGVPQFQRRS